MKTVSEPEPKKRLGRPPKPERLVKSEHIALYATPAQAKALQKKHREESPEISLSEWALKKLLGG